MEGERETGKRRREREKTPGGELEEPKGRERGRTMEGWRRRKSVKREKVGRGKKS